MQVVFLPGSSSATVPLYAVVVSTDVEVDIEEERKMELAKADENGEEYDQIAARWGPIKKEELPGMPVVLHLHSVVPPLAHIYGQAVTSL